MNREQIGAIGICGSGGFALSAAAMDSRIKAIATSVMYDISSIGNSTTGEERQATLEGLSQQRWADFENGEPAFQTSYPDAPTEEIPEGLDPVTEEFYSFYGTERGWHPNALGNVTTTSMLSLMNFPSLAHISEIAPRPILFIVGENAHSVGFSETAYANAAEQRSCMWFRRQTTWICMIRWIRFRLTSWKPFSGKRSGWSSPRSLQKRTGKGEK